MPKKIIVAIDGYSSCGKSTLAKALAAKLSYIYVDTGAMYRAATLYLLQHNIILLKKDIETKSPEFLNNILENIKIHFQYNPALGYSEVFLNDKDVEEDIRQMDVSNYVSTVSAFKEVRNKMVQMQQKIGFNKGIVMDGRDIGTKVFPKAELKIFMTAEPEIRAGRRYKELLEKGIKVSLEEIRENLLKRDYEDTNRKESPLVQASDAVVLNNSDMTEEQQLKFVLDLAYKLIR